MGLASKRKGRWRYRCWQKIFLAIIGFPLVAAAFLGLVAVIRALVIHQQAEAIMHLLRDQASDIVDKSKIMQRAERLAGALRIPTVSYATDKQEKQALLQFHQYLEKSGALHATSIRRNLVANGHSMLETPVPVRSQKLRLHACGQYLGG